MAYFNWVQEQYLTKLLDDLIGNDVLPEERSKLLDLRQACNKNTYDEITRQDVEMVLDNHEGDSFYENITDEEMKDIIHKVQRYDYSDYNEFIDSCINEVLDKREPDEDED